MLHAFVIACNIMSSGLQCGTFTDEYGPYKTAVECEERLKDMTPYAVAMAYRTLGPKVKYDSMCGTIEDILIKFPWIKGTKLDPRFEGEGQEA